MQLGWFRPDSRQSSMAAVMAACWALQRSRGPYCASTGSDLAISCLASCTPAHPAQPQPQPPCPVRRQVDQSIRASNVAFDQHGPSLHGLLMIWADWQGEPSACSRVLSSVASPGNDPLGTQAGRMLLIWACSADRDENMKRTTSSCLVFLSQAHRHACCLK